MRLLATARRRDKRAQRIARILAQIDRTGVSLCQFDLLQDELEVVDVYAE
jgi:hypothetical protein